MDGCTAINFVKHVKIVFLHIGVVCTVWWHLRELSQQSNTSCIHTALCTMTKLRWRQFWHALQKWLQSSHSWPNMNNQCTTWKKINMLSSTDNSWFFFSILIDIGLNLGFLFVLNSHCIFGLTRVKCNINWRAQFQNQINPLLMKIEFLTSLELH